MLLKKIIPNLWKKKKSQLPSLLRFWGTIYDTRSVSKRLCNKGWKNPGSKREHKVPEIVLISETLQRFQK